MKRIAWGLAFLAWVGAARAAEITVALNASPSSADPHFHEVTPNNELARLVFGTLVVTDSKLVLQPDLALSWKLLDDLTWSFELDPAARFHDGTPFTANDVVYSLCRAGTGVGPTHSFTTAYNALTGIDVPDAHHVVLRTRVPEPTLLTTLSNFAIISAQRAGAGEVRFSTERGCGLPQSALPPTSDFDNLRMAVGTGRYRLTRFTAGDAIVLEGVMDRAGAKPRWNRVTLKPVPAAGARLAGLMAGDFDLIENPAAQDLPTLKQRGGFAWTVTPSLRIVFLQPDIGRETSPLAVGKDGANPLRDPRVREALSLAIDRKAIATRLMDGLAEPADQYVVPGLFGAMPDAPKRVYDPERARKLLAEAGYPDGFALTFSATNDRYINDAKVAQALGQFFTRVGIRTTVDAMTQTTFFPRRAKRDFSLSMGGWGDGSGEGMTLLRYFALTTNAARSLGTSNYGGWSNPEFDAAMLPALQEMDPKKRQADLWKATSIALRENALIPLYWETSVWAFKDRYTFTGRADQNTDVDGLALRGAP